MLPYGRKNPLPFPFFRSGRRSPIAAVSSKGKVGVQRGRKTAGCPSFLPTAVGTASPPRRAPRRSRRPQTANPPLRFSENLPARKGRTRLRQFAHPAGSVQKRSRPVRGEHAYAVRMPRSPGAENGAARTERSAYAPRMHRTAGAKKPCRRFVHRHIKAKPRFPSVFFFICGGANRSCDRLRGAHRPDGFRCPT